MVTDDWPPMTDQEHGPRKQGDWPWRTLLHERPFTREGNYLFYNSALRSTVWEVGSGVLKLTNLRY